MKDRQTRTGTRLRVCKGCSEEFLVTSRLKPELARYCPECRPDMDTEDDLVTLMERHRDR